MAAAASTLATPPTPEVPEKSRKIAVAFSEGGYPYTLMKPHMRQSSKSDG